MPFLATLLICTTLGVVFAERIFDPKYEGNEEIANFRIDLSGKDPVFEWDFLAEKREYVGFDIILDPPIFIDDEGKPHHESTTDTVFTARRLKPLTQYNVTIKAYRHSEPIDAVSETLTFKTKPSVPEIRVFKLANWSHNENFTHQADLVLGCYVDGVPTPNITLFHNEQRIEPDEEFGGFSLMYFNRSLTSYGTYSCNATNVAGSVRKDIEHHYTENDSDILINTLVSLVDQSEETETRMNKMEDTLNEMRDEIKEIQELLRNETTND